MLSLQDELPFSFRLNDITQIIDTVLIFINVISNCGCIVFILRRKRWTRQTNNMCFILVLTRHTCKRILPYKEECNTMLALFVTIIQIHMFYVCVTFSQIGLYYSHCHTNIHLPYFFSPSFLNHFPYLTRCLTNLSISFSRNFLL